MRRGLKRFAMGALGVIFVFVAVIALLIETGLADRWSRGFVIRRIESATGARVELRGFHFSILKLSADLDYLTLHGRELPGAPPFFHTDHIRVRVRILSFFSRKFALDELTIERPEVAIQIWPDGRSNVPSPASHHAGKAWQQQLFDLHTGKFEWRDGEMTFNNQRAPLSAKAGNLELSLFRAAPAAGEPIYAGRFSAQPIEISAKKFLPVQANVDAKFTLTPSSFSLDELRVRAARSEIAARAEMASFAQRRWTFHSRGQLNLRDVREIFRKKNVPEGTVEFSGKGQLQRDDWSASGHFDAHEIALPYVWFHSSGIETWGDYEAGPERLRVPDFRATALGGELEGRLEMENHGLRFRVESRFHHANLARTLAAASHPGFPLRALHWDASMETDTVCTWTGGFKHFEAKGASEWSQPSALAPGTIPVTARLPFDYVADRHAVTIKPGEISTPASRLSMAGFLDVRDSGLEISLHSENLLDWNDLINGIRGPNSEPVRVAGRADWKGRVLGPLSGPTFAGRTHILDARYERLAWDEMDGQLEYSPDSLRLTNMRVRRGDSAALLNLELQFDGAWNFLPQSPWRLTLRLDRADTDPIQEMLGVRYPAHALLSGELRGSGTRIAPVLDAQLTATKGQAWGYRVDQLSGAMHITADELRFTGLDLRQDAARARADLLIRPTEKEIEFSLTGQGFSLGNLPWIQTPKLPISGEVSFSTEGRGPFEWPQSHGSFALRNLQVGAEQQGGFNGHFDSDGSRLQLTLDSEMTHGRLDAQFALDLRENYPLTGGMTVEQFDIDPFIIAGLRLKNLTGHSSVDARLEFGGELRHPDTLRVDAHMSRASFDYEFVKLENDGPLDLTYRRNEVRIERAHLHGPNTDFVLAGNMRFDRDRPLTLNLSGAADLRLAAGFFPGLDSHGVSKLEVSIEGTMSEPSITGRASVADASVSYDEFPVGLSHVTGDFVFDRSRLSFDDVAAQAGGGDLKLSGAVNYGEGPLRYQISVAAPRLRVRYPEGASWVAGGTLQLSGTTQGGTATGNVAVERLLLGEGADIAAIFTPAAEVTGGGHSAYARNLQLDVAAETVPGASLDWTGAHIEMDGSLHVRGTLERPILLGSIRLLGGEMTFRGNRYELSRGDIVFSNPLRLDPVLNVEATTTIGQNQITINFSGPASHLTLAYRSDPPLPDSDIVALLALGSTGESSALRSSTSTTSQSFGATALLSEAISSQLGGRIERLFGITRFRVDPFLSGTSTEQNPAARVTIEQQVAHDLTITYSTNAASNQQQVVQVEYNIRRDITVIALRDLNGTYSLSFEFKKHFK